MRKIIFTTLSLLAFYKLNAQVGIGHSDPKSMLDILSTSSSSTTKALEITNSDQRNVTSVYNNGNFEFNGALMPNGNPGTKGSFLLSSGEGLPPVWKKFEGPNGSKIITQVFNALNTQISTELKTSNIEYKLSFPTVILNMVDNLGTWNKSTNEITVNKKGVYYITAGFTASNIRNFNLVNQDGIMYINTSVYRQGIKGQITDNVPNNVYDFNFSGEIIVPLNIGDKIWISSIIKASSSQYNSFIHIKYSEI